MAHFYGGKEAQFYSVANTGNPAAEGGAKYLSPTDPAAAWNTKEGRGRFGYFTNYIIDTAHAVIVDVEATPARLAQEIKASKAMLGRIEERHGIKPEHLAADKAYGTGPFLAWLPSATLHRISRCWTANGVLSVFYFSQRRWQSPTEPIDGSILASSQRLPKAKAV